MIRCGTCGREIEYGADGVAGYSRYGWPRCCGEVMSFTAADLHPPDDTPPPRTGLPGRVLLVDDDPDVRQLAALVLRRAGFVVVEAESGVDAVRVAAHTDSIDLLATDLLMPGMGGVEVADRLAAARPGLRVLYLSGLTADEVDGGNGKRPGVRFLGKPFTPDELTRAVRELMAGVPGAC